jgi:radical SAM protein with 4Fe4S-binding SPASM domain
VAVVVAAAAVVAAEAAEAEADMQSSLYRPKGLLLQWHLTNRCNLRCSHCYQETYGGGELSFDELLAVLRQYEALLAEWRNTAGKISAVRGHITLTGGEPFVRKDFVPFLEHVAAARERYSFAILTNGSFVDVPIARELRRLRPRFVQVSVEGGEATHDRIRGAGDFRRTIRAIKRLVRFGVPTMISFTAHRQNYREFPEVARLGVKLGVDKVWSDRLIPAMSKGNISASDCLTPAETAEFFQLMAAGKREARQRWFARTEIAMHRALQFLVDGGEAYHCTAGDSLITIMPKGEVYPCRRMPIEVGNVREQSLREIYYSSTLLRQLRDPAKVSAGCESCAHTARCRGGLKCLSYAVTGDPFQRDPGCWLPDSDSRVALVSAEATTCFDDRQV